MLRTRSPLGFRFPEGRLNLVRLACVKHAASVRPEPGSNSPTKACRRSRRLPRATNDCCRAQDRFGISPQSCDLDMITFCCHRKGIPATELTSSSSQRLAPPPTELPALAFCLLFRFQGAEALRTSATDFSGPTWCLLFRRREPSEERSETLLASVATPQPVIRKKPPQGGATCVRAAAAGSARAATAARRAWMSASSATPLQR